jgi:hypothetical protein
MPSTQSLGKRTTYGTLRILAGPTPGSTPRVGPSTTLSVDPGSYPPGLPPGDVGGAGLLGSREGYGDDWGCLPPGYRRAGPEVAFRTREVNLDFDGFQLTVHGLRLLASSPRSQAVTVGRKLSVVIVVSTRPTIFSCRGMTPAGKCPSRVPSSRHPCLRGRSPTQAKRVLMVSLSFPSPLSGSEGERGAI